MAGLIQSELDDDLVKPKDMLDAGQVAQAGSVGYDADTRTVDAGKETVAGQMDTLLNAESPYLTRARTRAAQTANSRGLLNSSIAAGAGEAAAIDASLPIASQDASIYGTASRDNQAARNQASQFGASEANTSARLNTESLNQAQRMQLGAELEKSLIGTRTAAETALIGTRAGAESTLSAQQAAQQQALSRVQGEIEQGLITTREQADARLKELAGQIETGLVGTRAGAESTLQEQRAAQERGLTELRGQLEQQLQSLRGGQAEMLAGIEANYRSLIQASASATSFYTDMVKNISAVMANVDTTVEQKQAAVDTMGELLQSGLNIIGGIANIDIAGLLDFSAQG
jgi:primosomal protein N'